MQHLTHDDHPHEHGSCDHPRIEHGDHSDYLHDGHLHHVHDGHVDEHRLDVTSANPDGCAEHPCEGHARDHAHGTACGHERVPHGDHEDYLVDGHLHSSHEAHCDDHGRVTLTR